MRCLACSIGTLSWASIWASNREINIFQGHAVWRESRRLSRVNFPGENRGMPESSSNSGIVYLIGAGPGDPGLFTLRGAELLARCDVVLYDGLSNIELLKHAPSAEKICVGKHGQQRIWRQEEIITEMLLHANAGRKVVRLKGGDPAVFARTSEEVDALRAADIPFEIVPGITAALAAGSYAGIPITHRRHASAVALVTGHEDPTKAETALDWDALAKFPGTLVIYMGVTTAGIWTKALIDAGKSPDTTAALIRRCSHGDQQTIHCRLDEVADRLTPASKFRPPVITIIGPVTQLAESMNWLERKPLFGQSILVTRPADQAQSLAGPLRELGANVLLQPAIQITALTDYTALDKSIAEINASDILIFCSRNGVQSFMNRMMEKFGDIRHLNAPEIATVGSQSAKALQQYHLQTDIIPPDFSAASLAKFISPHVRGNKITIVRASRGSDTLAKELSAAGADVCEVVAYEHTDTTQPDPKVAEALADGQVDWVTVTSSASAQSLHNLFGDSLKQTKIASLSPITSKTLTDLGYDIAAEANPYTIDSLIDAIEGHR